MKVIDFEPHFWFFLSNDTDYFIDVNCSNSFVGFSSLIKLNEIETNEYKKIGKEFLNFFANDIQYYALSKYKERNVFGDLENEIHNSIMKFNKEKNFS